VRRILFFSPKSTIVFSPSFFLFSLSFYRRLVSIVCPLPFFFFLLSFLPLLADTSHTLHSIFFSFLFPRHFFLLFLFYFLFFYFYKFSVSFSHAEVLCIAKIVYWVSPQVRGERKLHPKKIYTQD
jgi:hypothetical protein